MREWIHLACRRRVVRRALKYAVGIGALLIAINHGDALLRGELGPLRLAKMALTVLVPYLVSTASSVAAMREGRQAAPEAAEREGAAG